MTAAFLIALLLGGGLSGVFAFLWRGALSVLAAERAALAKYKVQSDKDQQEALASVTHQLCDQRDAAISALTATQAAIQALEADNHACNSPARVRERLRKLAAPK